MKRLIMAREHALYREIGLVRDPNPDDLVEGLPDQVTKAVGRAAACLLSWPTLNRNAAG